MTKLTSFIYFKIPNIWIKLFCNNALKILSEHNFNIFEKFTGIQTSMFWHLQIPAPQGTLQLHEIKVTPKSGNHFGDEDKIEGLYQG